MGCQPKISGRSCIPQFSKNNTGQQPLLHRKQGMLRLHLHVLSQRQILGTGNLPQGVQGYLSSLQRRVTFTMLYGKVKT